MDFNWAIQKLKEGKKVRMNSWEVDKYLILKKNIIFEGTLNGIIFKKAILDDIDIVKVEFNDWEIFNDSKEEMKSLSGKLKRAYCDKDDGSKGSYHLMLYFVDVKEAVRKLNRKIKMWDELYPNYSSEKVLDKIKEIFGSKLL